MLTEKSIAEALLHCQSKRKTVGQLSKLLAGWDAVLEQEENALRSLPQLSRDSDSYEMQFREAQLSLPGMGLPNAIEVVANTQVRGRKRKDGKSPMFKSWRRCSRSMARFM
jgi:hypothetical protein